MPIAPRERLLSVAREVIKTSCKNPSATHAEMERIISPYLERLGLEFIGRGSETITFAPKQGLNDHWQTWIKLAAGHEVVFAVHYKYPRDIIRSTQTYYLQRMLNLLFPNNFPRIYAFYGSKQLVGDGLTGSIRQRVFRASESVPVLYPIAVVEEVIAGLGLPIVLDYGNSGNFVPSADGREWYVDTLSFRPDSDLSFPSLSSDLWASGYSPQIIARVNKSVQRIRQLGDK